MSLRYYDEILTEKIKRWLPEASHVRVLKPEESRRFFELRANDASDAPMRLPCIALSRDTSFDIETNIKTIRSYSGLTISGDTMQATHLNAIPITLKYTLDIYTKTMEEGDEYLRSYLFKLVNNPKMTIALKYNGVCLEHTAYLRVGETVSDTSAISERLFSGQFTKWSIELTLYDTYLFNIPYRQTWALDGVSLETTSDTDKSYNEEPNPYGGLEWELQADDLQPEKIK